LFIAARASHDEERGGKREEGQRGIEREMFVGFDAFLLIWVGAIASLGAALWLLSFYFRVLGTELSLNSSRKELVLALVVSAVQAGAVWFVLPFMRGAPHTWQSGRGLYTFPLLACVLLYKAAHVADWDQYEPMALAFFQGVISAACGMVLMGQFGLAAFVLTGFATALLVIGAIVKQA
jgi:hypothetical protein